MKEQHATNGPSLHDRQSSAGRASNELSLTKTDSLLLNVFDQVGDAIVLHNEQGEISEWNAAAERLTGLQRQEVIARQGWDVLYKLVPDNLRGPDLLDQIKARHLKFLRTGQSPHLGRAVEVTIQRPDGQLRTIEEVLFAVKMTSGHQLGAIIRDVTTRKLLAERERDRESILELLARDADLTQVLERIARWVERFADGAICAIRLATENRRLRPGAAPNLPDEFARATSDLEIAAGMGSCGSAAYSGQRVLIEDMLTHADYTRYQDVVRRAGLRSCWSEPVFSSTGSVLGTVAAYHHELHTPEAAELQLTKSAADLASLAIERKKADEALKASEARWRSLVESASAAITMISPDGVIQWANESSGLLTMTATTTGRRVYEFLPAAVHDQVRALLETVFVDQQRQTFESEYPLPDGTTLFLDHRISPIIQGDQVAAALVISTDISERKRAEAALRDGEAKYHAFFDAELDAIFLIEQATGQIIDANRSAERQYGCALDDLLQMTIVDLSAEPDVTRRDLQLSSVYTPLRYHRKRDGSVFPAEVTANSFVWQNRSVVMVAVRDIAERQRAEDALKQRNRELAMLNRSAQALTSTLHLSEVLELVLDELRRLLDVSASSIWLIDPTTRDLVCRQATGPRAETVRGWRISVDQGIVGWTAKNDQSVIITDAQTDERHFPGVDRSTGMPMRSIVSVPLRVKHEVIGVIQAVDEMPARFDASSLRLIELLANSAAIAVENARLYEQIQHHASDLERRVDERTAELQREQARLQAVFDSAGEGIQIMDCNFVITYCNPATASITGYSAEEIVGLPSRLITPGALPGLTPDDLRRTLARGEIWRGELVSRHKDGTAFDLAVTVSPLRDQAGNINGYVSVHRDITGLKELDRLRDQFVSRIGHELRTPLTSLIIYLDLLDHGKLEKRNQYLATLRQETDRLRRLIEGFLKIAELDANRILIEPAATDLNQLAGEIVQQHRPRAEQRQIQLSFEPAGDLPPALLDGELVQDVVQRLLDNALNYTQAGNSVWCTTAMILEADQKWVTLTVKDNGPGLLPDELPRLFERFYRGHAARNYTVPGVGLSLAICKEAMAKLGGRITAEITPDRLTAFTIWLRAA